MRLRVLGAVELGDGETDLLCSCHPAHRAVLALLALRANQVVSRTHLVARLWGERQPKSADNLIQGYVSRLRTVLHAANGDQAAPRILTRARATN